MNLDHVPGWDATCLTCGDTAATDIGRADLAKAEAEDWQRAHRCGPAVWLVIPSNSAETDGSGHHTAALADQDDRYAEIRGEVVRLNAEAAALRIALRGCEAACEEIKAHAVTTAAANDLIRKSRDEFRDAAMAREAELTRLAADWRGQADTVEADGDEGWHRGQAAAIRRCAERLTSVLNGGRS